MIRTVGAIGDVHTEDAHLETAIDFLAARVDRLMCVGDIADGEGDFERCCKILRDNEVDTVRGNHDRWIEEGSMRTLPDASSIDELEQSNAEWLSNLPITLEYDTAGGRLLLCHGLHDKDMAKVGPDDYGYAIEANLELQDLLSLNFRFVINGHSHQRMVRTFGGTSIINAGTLKRRQSPCFVILDTTEPSATFYLINDDLSIKKESSVRL